MAQWWTLVTMPTRSCLRPSMTHISHSGRVRSSWRLAICAGELGELAASTRGRGADAPQVVVEVEVLGPRPTPGG